MSQKSADVMLGVFTAHSVQSPKVEIQVEVDGKAHVIVGRSTAICDVTKPILNLLTSDCSPGRTVKSDSAEADFMTAVESLVRDGREFISALRVFWSLPVIEWSLKVQSVQTKRSPKMWTEIPYFQIAGLADFDRGDVIMQNIPGRWEIEPLCSVGGRNEFKRRGCCGRRSALRPKARLHCVPNSEEALKSESVN